MASSTHFDYKAANEEPSVAPSPASLLSTDVSHEEEPRQDAKTQETIQMMTMDLSGDDRVTWRPPPEDGVEPVRNDVNSDQTATNGNTSWWKRKVGKMLGLSKSRTGQGDINVDDEGHAQQEQDEETVYQPMEDDEPHHTTTNIVDTSHRGKTSPSQRKERRVGRSLLSGDDELTAPVDALRQDGSVDMDSVNRPTREDSLHQDCSLFFRIEDEGAEAPNSPTGRRRQRRGFRALRQHEHQHAFSYKDAVDVLAPTFLKHYKARYEQLNQDLTQQQLQDDGDDYPRHSLLLRCGGRESTAPSEIETSRIVRTETAVHSSLFYHHNGKTLMRLPMDQVRLFMDPDLEAGVLSVEQWRSAKSDEKFEESEERPQLRYVMTVDADLYRRMVEDMANRRSAVMTRCCHDNEKADIRIALVIIVVVLIILFVNTIIWGPVS